MQQKRSGAGGENRTPTLLRGPDFESGASASSTTPAFKESYKTLLPVHLKEVFYRAIIRALIFLVKKASRQFTVFPVIMQAFTALILLTTGRICAIAIFFVVLWRAFHRH